MNRVRGRLCKIAFESLYGPFAWAYDWVSHTFFLGQWRFWQRATLRFLEGNRVLELGMGTGNLQLDLHHAGYEAWGVDLSPQMLRQAAAKAKTGGVRLRVCQARAQALPFPSEYFDSVVSTFPSEYIADGRTLKEIARVLRPGGRLVIVPGGWLRTDDAKGKAFEGVARLVYGYKGGANPEETLRKLRQSDGWYKLMSALKRSMAGVGFDISAEIVSNRRGSCLVIVGVRE